MIYFYKNFYFSTKLVCFAIFWWFLLINLIETGVSESNFPFRGKIILLIIFIFQLILGIAFVLKNKQYLKIKKKNFILMIPYLTCSILILLTLLFSFSYNYMKISLIILIIEIVLIRNIEINNENSLKYSFFNIYVNTKNNRIFVKNPIKSLRKYNKYNNFILVLCICMPILSAVFIVVCKILLGILFKQYVVFNSILLGIMILSIRPKTLYILDVILGNFICMEFECTKLDVKGGFPNSKLCDLYFQNNEKKSECYMTCSIDYSYLYKKKVKLIVGGFSHYIIQIIS